MQPARSGTPAASFAREVERRLEHRRLSVLSASGTTLGILSVHAKAGLLVLDEAPPPGELMLRVPGLPPLAFKPERVVFVTAETPLTATWLAALRGTSTLTVGEGTDFLRRGGMIAFVIVDQTVRFLIDDRAARGSGLRISSRVLALAARPGQAEPPR